MIKKYWDIIIQFIKFNIVGIVNTIVDFAIYTMLTEMAGFSYVLAKSISFPCGMLNSYLMNSGWTFRAERTRSKREIFSFILIGLFSYGVSLLIMYICSHFLNISSDFIINIIAMPISAIVSFGGNKLLVFNKKK